MAYFRCTTSGSGTGATITVSYESEVYGQTLTCTDGTHTYTKTAASTGSTVFTVPNGGTWTISVVMYGHTYSQQVIVVSDYTCTLELWSATVNISTTATELYSQTITVKKGGSTIGSTAFDSSGSATYIAPEEGTYTFECTYSGQTYSASVNITEETTYSVVISMGLELSQWLTAGGLDPSDYADLSEVLADQEAVRRLMTIHDSVDYLATASAGDEMMETIIADDICAKWINLRDYALDTLYANSDIADEMDDAGKYFLGEWVLEGQVPVMTSNTAPYGIANASNYNNSYDPYKAFTTDMTIGWYRTYLPADEWISYQFIDSEIITGCKIMVIDPQRTTITPQYKIQGSNDGTNWTDVSGVLDVTKANIWMTFNFENDNSYSYYRLYIVRGGQQDGGFSSAVNGIKLQFLKYQPKGNVPIMTSNTAPYGEGTQSVYYDSDHYAFRAFDGDLSTDWGNPYYSGDQWLAYKFVNPVCVKKIKMSKGASAWVTSYRIEASNDGTNWTDISGILTYDGSTFFTEENIDNANYYLYYRLYATAFNPSYAHCISSLQFYGREMKVSQATQPTDGREYILIGSTYYTEEWGEYDWDSVVPRKYLYDHGVELETITLSGTATKEPYDIKLSAASSDATATLDTTDYDLLRAVVGKYASGTNVLKAGSGSATFTAANMPYNQSLDVSNINGSNAVGVGQTSTGIFTAEEWWLE